MANNITNNSGLNSGGRVTSNQNSGQSSLSQLTNIVNSALNQLVGSTSEPRVVEGLASTSLFAIQQEEVQGVEVELPALESKVRSPYSPEIITIVVIREKSSSQLKIPGVRDILARFKTAQNWLEKIGLFYDLHFIATQNRFRRGVDALAAIFMQQLAPLPEEILFPKEEGDKTLIRLFKDVAHDFHGLDVNHLAREIDQFCSHLTPEREERFVKLLPLTLIPFKRAAGMREVSKRNDQEQINDQEFRKYFNDYFDGTSDDPIYSNSDVFFPAVSSQLLERILNTYMKKIDFVAICMKKLFKDQFTCHRDAYRKLMVLANCYQKNVNTLKTRRQCSFLTILFEIADVWMERFGSQFGHKPVFSALQEREIRRLKPTEHLFLAPAIVRSWVPPQFNSYDQYEAVGLGIGMRLQDLQKFRKYFD